MPRHLVADATDAVPITPLSKDGLEDWLATQPDTLKAWVAATRFAAAPGSISLVATAGGGFGRVLAGIGDEDPMENWAALPANLPEGTYRIDGELDPAAANRAALGWALGSYVFDRYRNSEKTFARLAWPDGCDRAFVASAARSTTLVRDLVNTPASDMGPPHLAAVARELAANFDGQCRVLVGEELLRENYPAIHAVGRASSRKPRLIDLTWGAPDAPKVTLVGKGVCFDTGGLDLKGAAFMKLMKKDMGGAAHVLGVARMVMAAGLPVRLRVLIPAVENSVAGNAMRPLDIIRTRGGTTIEIGNTDAEGRVVLADALTEAVSGRPRLLIDFATLTGAARVALGAELPALFSNDDILAAEITAIGGTLADPLWHMPLWKPYRRHIEGQAAELSNTGATPLGGAITAALFLAHFVDDDIPWAHIDLMAWNAASRPGRPEGGEAMGMRTVYELVARRFGGANN